jgi:hypothetical protein
MRPENGMDSTERFPRSGRLKDLARFGIFAKACCYRTHYSAWRSGRISRIPSDWTNILARDACLTCSHSRYSSLSRLFDEIEP